LGSQSQFNKMVKRTYKSAFTNGKSVKKYSKPSTTRYVSSADVSYRNGRVTTGKTGPEIKYSDTFGTGSTISNGGPAIISCTTAITRSTSAISRVGDRCVIKGINVNINGYQTFANSGVNFLSWSIVLDKQPNSAAPAASVIWANPTSNLCLLNVDYHDRFKVLARGQLGALNGGADLGSNISRFIKADIGCRFPDGNAEATTNAIFLCFNSNAALGNPVLVDYAIRLSFTDE